jgi:hypothetical protein
VVERTLIGDSGLQDVGTNDYDSQAMRSCRKGGGVPDSDPGKMDPGFAEKNFGRFLIFFRLLFSAEFPVPNETPAARFRHTRKPMARAVPLLRFCVRSPFCRDGMGEIRLKQINRGIHDPMGDYV